MRKFTTTLFKVKKTTFFVVLFATSFVAANAQTSLVMMAGGGPAGNGPTTARQVVTLYDATTNAPYSPAVTATISISNQQFGAGTVEGLPNDSMINFGASSNPSSDSILLPNALYVPLNAVGSSTNSMFSACNTCGAGSIDTAKDYSLFLANISDAFINAKGGNTQPLNGRVYVGDVTITFNRPVSNPVLQLSGLGGFYAVTDSSSTPIKLYSEGFATEFDLIGTNVTLSKLAGNSTIKVTSNQIINNTSYFGSSSKGASSLDGTDPDSVTRYSASGSVVALGENITSVSLKMYLRGDGGRVTIKTTGKTTTPNGYKTPVWSGVSPIDTVFATLPKLNQASEDVFLLGASLQKPVTVSGNVFNDPDGGNVNNSTGTTNSIPSGLFANLIDSSGKVVASVPVATNGTYSFPAIFEGSYTVNISTTAGTQSTAAPAVTLPVGWSSTGEFNGTPNTGNDGTINGTSAAFTVAAVADSNVNFGIKPSVVMPVTLISFTAQKQGANVLLNWSTSQEINNDHFDIERSADQNNWIMIGSVEHGNNAGINNYSFTDIAPLGGNGFYRLKQVDINGTVTYSAIYSLNLNDVNTASVYPSPAHDKLTVTGIPTGAQLRIVNLEGKILTTVMPVNNTQQISISNYPSSVYLLEVVQDGNVIQSIKFIKQ